MLEKITVKYRRYVSPHPRGFRTFFKSIYENIKQNYTIVEKLHSKFNFRQAMKSGWAQIFSKPRKTPQIEKHPYRCVICNSDSARFSFARTYACHMKAFHSFHDGYDLSLPEPSARKVYALPKIEKKKKVKKKPVFANKEEALQHVRSKSKKRGHLIFRVSIRGRIQSVIHNYGKQRAFAN